MAAKGDRRQGGEPSLPKNRRHFQRRQEERHSLGADISLEKEGLRVFGRVVDISMSGLCADLYGEVPSGADYTVQFSFGREFCSMNIPAKIVRAEPEAGTKHIRVGIGFTRLETIERKVLVSCLEEVMKSPQNGSDGKDNFQKLQISFTIIDNKILADRGRRRRAVITGLGVVSPIGVGKAKFFESLRLGRSGVSGITRFDVTSFPSKVAAEVKDFDPLSFISKKKLKHLDLCTQYAIAATQLAFEDAQLKLTLDHTRNTAVLIGTAVGGLDWAFKESEVYFKKGHYKMSPHSMVAIYPNACAGQVCIEFGIKGQSDTLSSGCASAGSALGMALELIQQGKAEIVCVGGAEAPLNPAIFGAMCSAGALTTLEKTPRPFDDTRDGPALGEGAGIIIIEEYGHALRRDAHIYAEVIGWGSTADAFSLTRTAPDGSEAVRAMYQALNNSGRSREEIDYISAYGIASPACDWTETAVIKEVFGDRAYKIPISAIQSMVGYGWAAIGAFQTVSNCLVISEGFIPPTINYENFDPLCDLDYVPNHMRSGRPDIVMSNIFGCGKNVVILLQRVDAQ